MLEMPKLIRAWKSVSHCYPLIYQTVPDALLDWKTQLDQVAEINHIRATITMYINHVILCINKCKHPVLHKCL